MNLSGVGAKVQVVVGETVNSRRHTGDVLNSVVESARSSSRYRVEILKKGRELQIKVFGNFANMTEARALHINVVS